MSSCRPVYCTSSSHQLTRLHAACPLEQSQLSQDFNAWSCSGVSCLSVSLSDSSICSSTLHTFFLLRALIIIIFLGGYFLTRHNFSSGLWSSSYFTDWHTSAGSNEVWVFSQRNAVGHKKVKNLNDITFPMSCVDKNRSPQKRNFQNMYFCGMSC